MRVVFPEPGVPDQRNRQAGLDVEVNVVEHRAIRLVAERDMVEPNMPFSWG